MPHSPDELPRNLQSRSFLEGQAAPAAGEVEDALRTPLDPSAAAFFDVDNTIMQGASIFHLARGLHRRKFFTTRDIVKAAWQQVYFQYIGGESAEHIESARNSALSFIAGHEVSELEQIGDEVFDEYMADKIWPGTRALAQWHLDRGQRVWLVTAAPIEIARTIARRLGLTGALGTVPEAVDGVYTGRLVGEMLHGESKSIKILELAEAEGLDLSKCYAYSDSSNDIPMLSLVGHPTAVNPDNALAEHAKANGWKIRDYRHGRRFAVGVSRSVAVAATAGASWYVGRKLLDRSVQGR
jgi:HAD superfamily hydrolase (TIGR01490 family)